jgi:endonuclease/exonuclease/phosphatase family metal-dependent hydrolase
MPRLRLITVNAEGNRSHWPTRKRQLRSILSTEVPDLVGLQEILRPQGPGSSQADELAEGLGYRVGFSRSSEILRPFASELGIAVLSRYPLREQRSEPLPSAGGAPAVLLYAVCSVKVGLLPLYITQLGADPSAAATAVRCEQLGYIARYVAAEQALLPSRVPSHVAILPPLLLGDLGAPPDSQELSLLKKEGGFVDCASPAGAAAGRYALIGRGAAATTEVRVAEVTLCWSADQPGDKLTVRAGLRVDLEI